MNNSQSEEYLLIVDDQKVSVKFLEKILIKKGYQIVTALDGKIALDIIKTKLPQLILLDIMMPNMNGFEVCSYLKNNEITEKIPIIFLTSLDDIEAKVKAFQVGGVDYITKPYQEEEIIIRIETHLRIKKLEQQLKEQNELLKKANEKLKKLCLIDDLTQITNRRGFEQNFSKEWRRMLREKQYLSLVLCDIDYFKLYNDKYGHQKGDRCLKKVAQIINISARRPGDIVARYGGEEFVILLPNTPSKGAIHVAELIRNNLNKLGIIHEDSPINNYVTLSLGISSIIPTLNYNHNILLETADLALYEAKYKGRNCIIYKDIIDKL